MGKLLTKKPAIKKAEAIGSTSSTAKKEELYKPISDFSWKDASRAEIHQNSINAYKKYAF